MREPSVIMAADRLSLPEITTARNLNHGQTDLFININIHDEYDDHGVNKDSDLAEREEEVENNDTDDDNVLSEGDDEQHGQIIMDACVGIAKNVGKMRTAIKLFPSVLGTNKPYV
ncbi:unnamed protein product [Dovyalis caffra]|uniref:Uncharacterized protein n=1 Tax=Dovyalis caffra TaxID=77055 RepID=A0AAV1RX31_9ROSI|nr:unnamed protein product [Dovyalis caffra]